MNIYKTDNRFVWRFALIWAAVTVPVIMALDKTVPWIGVVLVLVGSGVLIAKEIAKGDVVLVCVKPSDDQKESTVVSKWQLTTRSTFMRGAVAAGLVAIPVASPCLVVHIPEFDQAWSRQQPIELSTPQTLVILVEAASEPTVEHPQSDLGQTSRSSELGS
jgi:hypothetical protein